MRSIPRALAIAAVASSVPLSIFVACGSSTFTSDDPDSSTVSPQNDASLGDAQASDASANADAAPPPPTWCQTNAPNAYFCADFDEGDFTKGYCSGELQTVFTTTTVLDGGAPGTVIELGDAGESPPGSLHVNTPSTNFGQESAQTQTAYKNAAGATGFQIDFDLRNDASGCPDSLGTTVQIEIKDPTDGVTFAVFQVNLTSNGEGSSETGFSNGGTVSSMGPLPIFDVWTHYRVVVQLAGDVTVEINDAGAVDKGSSGTKISTSNLQLTLGQDCAFFGGPPQCGQEVSFDNVVIHALGTGDGG